MSWKKILWWGFGLVVLLGLAIQGVPYGRVHAVSPMRREPAWDRPATRALAVRACFDCHSNQTVWPWYARMAPISWLVERDVDEGRGHVNFSEWDRLQRGLRGVRNDVMGGEMPPWYYLPLHPQARLSLAEKEALLQGLAATIEKESRPRSRRHGISGTGQRKPTGRAGSSSYYRDSQDTSLLRGRLARGLRGRLV